MEQLFRKAVGHFQAGQLAEAQELSRRILASHANSVPALSLMGMIQMRLGQIDSAIALLRRAVSLQPGDAGAQGNLGIVLSQANRLGEAIIAFERAVALDPNAAAHHSNLGNVLSETGKFDQAIAAHARAVKLQSRSPEFHYRLGVALRRAGRFEEALVATQRAISLNGNYAEAYNALGTTLVELGLLNEAAAAYQQAIAIQPNVPGYHTNLGRVYRKLFKFDDSVAEAHRAIVLQPDFSEGYRLLGDALREQGLVDQSMCAYDQALAYEPDHAATLSNRAFTMLYQPGRDSADLLGAARLWATRCADRLRPSKLSFANDRSKERRLRVGYVSPDFRRHAAASFLLPLLRHHDPDRFEVICYSSVKKPDEVTAQLRRQAAGWQDVARWSDDQLAARIREDHIDILVDLAQHTAGNRLLAFARKPAPVQVTWLGYPGTTGLAAMDYRLTDPHLDPPGTDSFYTEQSIRLPRCFWCYEPPKGTPDVSELPSLTGGEITFGCLNTFRKVNPQVLEAWCALLRRVPRSRLLLHAHPGSHRERAEAQLAAGGIDPARLEWSGQISVEDYFRLYHRIDIALDPFPFTGGTTTCDALWMGVPVIGIAGATAVGRASLSVLTNAGLAEWVADHLDQYIDLAARLANDPDRLRDLRRTLRPRVAQSPLMDGARFARNVEDAYTMMWQRWCEE